MKYALGKHDARPGAVQFDLAKYLPTLPIPPHAFGHEALVPSWGMLANGPDDSEPDITPVGDCVIAGGLHETMLWNAEAGTSVHVDSKAAIANYSAITGYNPDDPNSDRGTDMEHAARYRRRTGLIDADGKRHKIGAYLALRPGDVNQLWTALYCFGAVGIGLQLPESAEQQFEAGHVLDYVPGSPIAGGHYVSAVARRGFIGIVTWGRIAWMTPRFLQEYCDEAIVYLSPEMLHEGVSIDGFDQKTLVGDLSQLKAS